MLAERRPSFIKRIIPEVLKKPFPIVAKSYEDFVGYIEREGIAEVKAQSGRTMEDGVYTAAVGTIGTNLYYSFLEGRTRTGRRVQLRELFEKDFGSERGIGDAEDRNVKTLRALYTAHTRLENLRERFPELVIRMAGPYEKQEMTEELKERMLQDVERLNLTPYQESVVRR